MVFEPREKSANAHRRKEGLLIRTTNIQVKQQCRVRSGTDDPCLRPAVIEVSGVPFCEPCACEQEAYFAIGLITEAASQQLEDKESLVDMLESIRWVRRRRHIVSNHEPEVT
jgi:hypothetical protein